MEFDILTKEAFEQFKNKGETALAVKDKVGNGLYVYMNGKVLLNIASEGKRIRDIGYIKDDSLFINRKETHIYRMNKSFGFNYNLLKYTELFNFVKINYEGTMYKIPKMTILNLGKIMYFKNASNGNSFELQIFLPLPIIFKYKIAFESE
jgi:hypothetical protein